MSRFVSSMVVVVAAAALTLSACSAGNGSGGGSTTDPSGGLTGEPVKFLTLTDTGRQRGDDQDAGTKIGIAAVNAAGGIKGRPVQEVPCKNPTDVNVANDCVRKALADGGVVALVGTGTTWSATINPMLIAAGMPNINNLPTNPPDFNCSVCFPSTTGALNIVGMATSAATVLNAKNVGAPYIGLPSGAGIPPLLDGFLKPLGAQVVGAIAVPPQAADVTPQAAAEGAAKPDAVAAVMSGDLLIKFLNAYRSQGFDTPFLLSNQGIDEKGIEEKLSGANDNVYVLSDYDHTKPAYQTFLDDKKKYAPDYPNNTEEVLRSYLAVKQFAEAATKATEITPAGILNVMRTTTDYDAEGLITPIDYSKPQTGGGGKFPTMYASHVYLSKYNDGKFEPMNDGKPVNVFTGQTS